MILASLARYYRRLAAETDETGNPKVPSYGFSEEKIGWILVLDKEDSVFRGQITLHFLTLQEYTPRLVRDVCSVLNVFDVLIYVLFSIN